MDAVKSVWCKLIHKGRQEYTFYLWLQIAEQANSSPKILKFKTNISETNVMSGSHNASDNPSCVYVWNSLKNPRREAAGLQTNYKTPTTLIFLLLGQEKKEKLHRKSTRKRSQTSVLDALKICQAFWISFRNLHMISFPQCQLLIKRLFLKGYVDYPDCVCFREEF